MNNNINITEVEVVDDELIEAFSRLLPQLSQNAKPITKSDLENILSSDNTFIITADDNGIVGVLTLVLYQIPTGIKARIEDVVVDENSRGQGIGQKLIKYAIEKATQAGAVSIDLTSNPNRSAANKLYQKMGFQQRQTNTYRHRLDEH
jgi:ribosomal protein S18 acetylase RimI-like enzyme